MTKSEDQSRSSAEAPASPSHSTSSSPLRDADRAGVGAGSQVIVESPQIEPTASAPSPPTLDIEGVDSSAAGHVPEPHQVRLDGSANDPEPEDGGRSETQHTAGAALDEEAAHIKSRLQAYYRDLKAGRRYRGWYLTEMLSDNNAKGAAVTTRPVARKLADPHYRVKVAVIDWPSLQSQPQSHLYLVGPNQPDGDKKTVHEPMFRGGMGLLWRNTTTRDGDGARLRALLLQPGEGTRLVVVEDLSRDVVGALGAAYGLDYQFFEEHICPRSDTTEALAGNHLPKPWVHFRWCHPIQMNRLEAQRMASMNLHETDPASATAADTATPAERMACNGAAERQSWDLPTHEASKIKSVWMTEEEKKWKNKSFRLSSLNAADQVPQHSSRNGTLEEQISLYFIPASPERGLPSTIIVLADPVIQYSVFRNEVALAIGAMYFDKRPSASIGEVPGSTADFILDTFRNMTWSDGCRPHAVHESLVSIITTLIRNDTVTAIIDMKTEMRTINTGRRILHAVENSIDLWDRTLSGIQEQLSIYRQAVKSVFAAQSVLVMGPSHQHHRHGQGHDSPLLFRRGLFADFGDDLDANKYTNDLLRLIDETLNQATETFNTLRTTLSIYESQQAIAQASAINRLTEMVFIFIPLSFSTSIFGMQVREFDDVGLGTWGIIAGLLLGAILALRLLASSRVYERLKAAFLDWVRDSQNLPPGSNVAGLDGAIALARNRALVLWTALVLTVIFVPTLVWTLARDASTSSKVGWTVFALLIPGAVGFFFPRFFIGRDWEYGRGYTTTQMYLSVFLAVVPPVALLPPLWVAMDAPLDTAIAWTVVVCGLSVVGASYWLDVFMASKQESELTTQDLWAAWRKTQKRAD